MLKGIDVSVHNNIIDWSKVKSQIDFAILRIGYGDNLEKQDDKRFYQNLKGCLENNISFGVYLYSYATNREHLDSEILHTKRILESINEKPFCVYFDMEDSTTEFLGKTTLTLYALTFCNEIKKLGYKTGVYANQNWLNNFLDCKAIYNDNNSIWVAKYSENKPNIPTNYDIWQYTSDGSIDGINGRVDMNYMYEDLISENKPKPTPQPINNKVNVYSQGYTKETGWLPQVKNNEDYVGYKNYPLRYLALKVDKGSIKYRVTTVSGKVLGWITGYNTNDFKNGCAGNGEPIATIEVYYYTPDNIRPYKKAKYKVNDYAWQYDTETTNGQDGYAGVKGKPATKFEIEIV